MPSPRTILLLSCSLFIYAVALAQSAHTPEPGTPERAAIIDAVRSSAQKDLKQSVIFKVERLRVAGNWAYVMVSPTRPDGGALDYSRTKFQKLIDLGVFDPTGEALLYKESDGAWSVLEWEFGATDVPSAAWPTKHRSMPKSLLE